MLVDWRAGDLRMQNGLTGILYGDVDIYNDTRGPESRSWRGALSIEKIGISAERLTLMMSIALRFIPTILDETHKILKAQAARGADLKELAWKEKGKLLVSLLVPVTVSAFRRAEELVFSMEARGFIIGEPRSEYHKLVWCTRATGFVLSFVGLIGVVLGLQWMLGV